MRMLRRLVERLRRRSSFRDGRICAITLGIAVLSRGQQRRAIPLANERHPLGLPSSAGIGFHLVGDSLTTDGPSPRWPGARVGAAQDGTRDGPKLHSVIVDPRDPAHLYVAMSGGGVHESLDRGETFAPLAQGLVARDAGIRPPPPGRPSRLAPCYAPIPRTTHQRCPSSRRWGSPLTVPPYLAPRPLAGSPGWHAKVGFNAYPCHAREVGYLLGASNRMTNPSAQIMVLSRPHANSADRVPSFRYRELT